MKKTVFAALAVTVLLSGCAGLGVGPDGDALNNHCGGCGDYSQENISRVHDVCTLSGEVGRWCYRDAQYYKSEIASGDLVKAAVFSKEYNIEGFKQSIAQDKESDVDETMYAINYAYDKATSIDDADQTAMNHCMDQYFPQYVNGAGHNWGLPY